MKTDPRDKKFRPPAQELENIGIYDILCNDLCANTVNKGIADNYSGSKGGTRIPDLRLMR